MEICICHFLRDGQHSNKYSLKLAGLNGWQLWLTTKANMKKVVQTHLWVCTTFMLLFNFQRFQVMLLDKSL